jgi:hypothetical protein
MNKVHIFFDEKLNLWFGYFENNPIFKIKGKTKDDKEDFAEVGDDDF